MALLQGELSFRKGGSQVVGLPLDVIDKVGAQLTERYYRNRQGASKIKEQLLSIPDSNSEMNKSIIKKLSDDVSGGFAEYAKEGTWFDADNAVYDAYDKMVANPDVKDLQQYAVNAAKTDKIIEDSKAPEQYKQIRREMNQKTNLGIKDKDGKRLQWQGKGLSGDLNLSKYVAKAEELVRNWKADVKSSTSGVSTVGVKTGALDMVMSHFTDRSVESVSEDEVRKLVYANLALDSNFQAELGELSELNLFASTGKMKADASDVMSVFMKQAESDPNIANQFIASSPQFQSATAGMKSTEKSAYLAKLSTNNKLRDSYIQSGVQQHTSNQEAIFGKTSNVYSEMYKQGTKLEMYKALEGVVGKASYTKIIEKGHYNDMAAYNGMIVKKHMDQLENTPIVTPIGSINKKAIGAYQDQKIVLAAEIDRIQGLIDNTPNMDPENRSRSQQSIDSAKSKMRAYDYLTDAAMKGIGMTNEQIIGLTKEGVKRDIRAAIAPGNINTAIQYSPDEKSVTANVDKLYDIASKYLNNIPAMRKAASEAGISVKEGQMAAINNVVSKRFKENLSNQLDNFDGEIQSTDVYAIGHLGKGSPYTQAAEKFMADNWKQNNGNWEIIDSSNPKEIGTTNATIDASSYQYKKTSTQNNTVMEDSPITVESVIYNKDSGADPTPTFRIRITNPNDGTSTYRIARFKGSEPLMQDYYRQTVLDAAAGANDPNNPSRNVNLHTAKMTAGSMACDTPVTSIDGIGQVEGLTLGTVLSTIRPNHTNASTNNASYANVSGTYGGAPITIVTSREGKRYHSAIYNTEFKGLPPNGMEPLWKIDNGSSPSTILQDLGGIGIFKSASTTEQRNNVGRMFEFIK